MILDHPSFLETDDADRYSEASIIDYASISTAMRRMATSLATASVEEQPGHPGLAAELLGAGFQPTVYYYTSGGG